MSLQNSFSGALCNISLQNFPGGVQLGVELVKVKAINDSIICRFVPTIVICLYLF